MKSTTFTLFITSLLASSSLVTAQQVINPNGNSTKCLTASSNADGATVDIQDCAANSTSQLWTVAGSAITIFGNKCLDNTNGVQTAGNKLQIFSCFCGDTNQAWTVSGSTIKLTNTNFCLDNTGGVLTDGNPAQIWTCTGGPNQKWTLAAPGSSTPPPPPPPVSGTSISPGKNASLCLTATSNADNAPVDVEVCDPTSAGQAWNVTGGNVQIFGNKCLDVPNGSTANGQLLQIFTCFQGNTNQLFTVTGDNRIAWTNKGECLDLTNGVANAGTKIQAWKCTDNDTNQVWNLTALKSSS